MIIATSRSQAPRNSYKTKKRSRRFGSQRSRPGFLTDSISRTLRCFEWELRKLSIGTALEALSRMRSVSSQRSSQANPPIGARTRKSISSKNPKPKAQRQNSKAGRIAMFDLNHELVHAAATTDY